MGFKGGLNKMMKALHHVMLFHGLYSRVMIDPGIALELPVATGAEARRPGWYELGATVAGSKWDLRDAG